MTCWYKYKMIFFLTLILSGLISLSGCGSTQKSNFYQLDEIVNPSLIGVEKGEIIGLGPIELAEYLNRPQIITRNSAHHLNLSEYHRWIEPLNDSITRTLVINLSNNLQTNRVYWTQRQYRKLPQAITIAVDIARFDGQLGGMVALESRWSVFDKNSQPLLTRVSLIKEPVKEHSYEALVLAMNKALQQLGLEISQAADSILNK